MLLSADAGTLKPPAPIGALDLLSITPPAEVAGASGYEAAASELGPSSAVAIDFATREAWTAATALAAMSFRTTSLMVQDVAGNSLTSRGGADPEAVLKTPGADYAPQLSAEVAPATAGEYGPMPEVGPPSPNELAALPRMPWSPSYSYTGSIDGRNATGLRIPVGPSTRTLTLDLKPRGEGEPFMPRIDQVFLLGRGGEELSRITGVSILGEGVSQTLYISIHGAPIGGEVVVRLVSMSAFAPGGLQGQETPGPVDGDGPIDDEGEAPAWDETYFDLSIRRNDPGARGAGASVATTAAGGTPYVVTLARTDAVTAIGPLAPAVDATATVPEVGPGRRVAVSTTGVADVDVDLADEGPVEVFLGPLVSRTAAALGPVLATTSDEPTPSTDRGARSQGDAPAAFGAELDLDMILAVGARGGRGGPSRLPDADPALTTLRGPGGVPIVVAGLGVGDDRAADDESLAASVLGAAQDGEPLLADAAGPEADEAEVARAGLATRALSFLIGMGLASGPLYPDLVALARRKFRRRPRRARKGRPGAG